MAFDCLALKKHRNSPSGKIREFGPTRARFSLLLLKNLLVDIMQREKQEYMRRIFIAQFLCSFSDIMY